MTIFFLCTLHHTHRLRIRLNESPAFLSRKLYSIRLTSKTLGGAKAFPSIGLNETTSKQGEMRNLLPFLEGNAAMRPLLSSTQLTHIPAPEHKKAGTLPKLKNRSTTLTKYGHGSHDTSSVLYTLQLVVTLGLWLSSLPQLQLSDLLAQGFHLTHWRQHRTVNMSCDHMIPRCSTHFNT